MQIHQLPYLPTTQTVQKQGQTYKVVLENQFIQFKPNRSTEQKYMTVKSQMLTKMSSSIVGTSKIYTLKTGSSGTHLTSMENTVVIDLFNQSNTNSNQRV